MQCGTSLQYDWLEPVGKKEEWKKKNQYAVIAKKSKNFHRAHLITQFAKWENTASLF
jgi:hypothetical protein